MEIKLKTQEQPANAMNRPAKQVPFALLLPVIEPQLDKDRAMQLQGLYVRLRSNNINKEEFVHHMRSLVGDHMLKMAVFKLRQGQTQLTAKPNSLPMDNNAKKSQLIASGSNVKTPPKNPTVSQKKPLEAPVSLQSKKQKVSGAFLDQSIEQPNGVTAVSGEEEEQHLFSGSKEDSRVLEASKKDKHKNKIVEETPLIPRSSPNNDKARVSRMDLDDVVEKINHHFVHLGSLLPEATNQLMFCKSRAERAMKKVSVKAELISQLKEKVKELEDRHAEDARVLNQMHQEHLKTETALLAELHSFQSKKIQFDKDRLKFDEAVKDRRWFVEEGVKYFVDRLHQSLEFMSPMAAVQSSVRKLGYNEGLAVGYAAGMGRVSLSTVKGFDLNAKHKFLSSIKAFESMNFPFFDLLSKHVDESLSVIKSLEPMGLSQGPVKSYWG